jgi:hypothetical protein
MAIKRKQKARDRSKEKTIDVPRRAAEVFKKRQEQIATRRAQKGDIVISQDHIGVFKVLSVSPEGLAELQPFLCSNTKNSPKRHSFTLRLAVLQRKALRL